MLYMFLNMAKNQFLSSWFWSVSKPHCKKIIKNVLSADHIHKKPEKAENTDFSRVKLYVLDGLTKYYRNVVMEKLFRLKECRIYVDTMTREKLSSILVAIMDICYWSVRSSSREGMEWNSGRALF